MPNNPIPASITCVVRSQRGNKVSAPSVQAEVVYGGPGLGFFSGAEALAYAAQGASNPGSADSGTLRKAA